VTVDIADELRRRYVEFDEVPESVLAFLEAANRRRASSGMWTDFQVKAFPGRQGFCVRELLHAAGKRDSRCGNAQPSRQIRKGPRVKK
jgi:hypothetical protein